MTTISMHQASVPLFQRQLGALLAWLDKAEAHAVARKFDANNYLQLRLAPDMLPFVSQIRIASDAAKGCVARLAGVEAPKFEDNEATMAELRARVQKTLDYIASVPAASLDGSEGRDIVIPMRPPREPVQMQGLFFLQHWALPNFYFHVTTAYALLRHAGVELGKGDFLAVA
jgi:hypothetical protein